jgi:hypothetical protein
MPEIEDKIARKILIPPVNDSSSEKNLEDNIIKELMKNNSRMEEKYEDEH